MDFKTLINQGTFDNRWGTLEDWGFFNDKFEDSSLRKTGEDSVHIGAYQGWISYRCIIPRCSGMILWLWGLVSNLKILKDFGWPILSRTFLWQTWVFQILGHPVRNPLGFVYQTRPPGVPGALHAYTNRHWCHEFPTHGLRTQWVPTGTFNSTDYTRFCSDRKQVLKYKSSREIEITKLTQIVGIHIDRWWWLEMDRCESYKSSL